MKNPLFTETELAELNKATEADRECDCGGEGDCEVCRAAQDENAMDHLDDEPHGSHDLSDDGDALASAGMGTDEDYGGGTHDWEGGETDW